MNPALDEPDLLTEVPPILKRLARVIVKAFYETEHGAIINLLVKHTCVKEDDMCELLKVDKKQLRAVLARLKNDKLIKQRVFKEKQADTGTTTTFNYFFIDYKLFVNVVKYKLDHIRNKIEHDEREATNRPSFVCKQCDKRYSDLEIDRLIDPTTGNLNCEFCSGPIDEDLTDVQQKQNSRSLLALFNDQMESVFALLKGCENIKLAPEVLEPSASLCMKQIVPRLSTAGSASKMGWNSKISSTENLYKQDIKVNMGDERVTEESKAMKETPVWIKQSTVGPTEDRSGMKPSTSDGASAGVVPTVANHDIMKDLLAHESVAKKPRLENNVKSLDDGSSDESLDEFSTVVETKPSGGTQGAEEDTEEEEEITVKIGDKEIPLDDITDEMIEKMTPEEHDEYMKAYQEAFNHLY